MAAAKAIFRNRNVHAPTVERPARGPNQTRMAATASTDPATTARAIRRPTALKSTGSMRALKASTRSSVFILRSPRQAGPLTGVMPIYHMGHFARPLPANSEFLNFRLHDHADVIAGGPIGDVFADGRLSPTLRPAPVISSRPASRSRHDRHGPCPGRSTSS